MITKDGTTIAHSNKDLVLKMYNAIEEAKKDDSLLALADIEKLMAQGKTGIDKYKFDGVEKYVGYAPVSGTQWSVAVVVSSSEIYLKWIALRYQL